MEMIVTEGDDPHRHLWPLSDWRFFSPVSYWHPQHYGDVFAPVEVGLVAIFAWLILRRFPSRPPQVGCGRLLLAYAVKFVGGLIWFGASAR